MSPLPPSEEHNAPTEPHPLPKTTWQRWRDWSGTNFIISILVHLVIILVATLLVVQVLQPREKPKFKSAPPSPNPPSEHSVKAVKKNAAMSVPTISKRITTTAANAQVALPAMEMNSSMPDMMSSALSNLGASGLGAGATAAAVGALPPGGLTAFGFKKGSGGLKGYFYDLKQTSDSKPTDMAESPTEISVGPFGLDPKWTHTPEMMKYVSELKRFVTTSWNTDNLAKYFRAPDSVTAYQVAIPYMKAADAPAAFGVEKFCKGRRWIVHYKGKFISPKSGYYRFVGFADDILFVRVNGANVLDACFYSEELQPDLRPKKAGKDEDVGPGPIAPLRAGKWFSLLAGEKNDIEMIIGEGPGGDFSTFLMIQEKGVEYPLGDYPVFQMKDIPLPDKTIPGTGTAPGTIPPNFSGKKLLFNGS